MIYNLGRGIEITAIKWIIWKSHWKDHLKFQNQLQRCNFKFLNCDGHFSDAINFQFSIPNHENFHP